MSEVKFEDDPLHTNMGFLLYNMQNICDLIHKKTVHIYF